MPNSTDSQTIHFCQELWANATNKQDTIEQLIPQLRAQITGIKDRFDEDSFGAADCDIAQQILTNIEKENNKPLTVKPPTVS